MSENDETGWDAAFAAREPAFASDGRIRATYLEQVGQALASNDAGKFLTFLTHELTIVASSAYRSDGLNLDHPDRAEYLTQCNELLGVVSDAAIRVARGQTADADRLRRALESFKPIPDFELGWIVEGTLKKSGATCAYCGYWGDPVSDPWRCRNCGRPAYTMEGIAMDMLRTAQVEFSMAFEGLDARAIAEIQSLFGERSTDELIVVSDSEVPDDPGWDDAPRRWIYLLDRGSHDFFTVKVHANDIWELEVTSFGDYERRESTGFLARYDERGGTRRHLLERRT